MSLPINLYVGLLFVLSCFSFASAQETTPAPDVIQPQTIIRQPKAVYTEKARAKSIEGAVRLSIELLASGQVGEVTLIKTKGWRKLQKSGLLQRAIDAAKQIEFTPKIVNGKPVSVVIIREYTFTVY